MKCPSCKGELEFGGAGTETHLKCTECGEGFTVDTGRGEKIAEVLVDDIRRIRASALGEIEKHLKDECDCRDHLQCWDATDAIHKRTDEEVRTVIAAAGEDRDVSDGKHMSELVPYNTIRASGDGNCTVNARWLENLLKSRDQLVAVAKRAKRVLMNVYHHHPKEFVSGVYDDPGDDDLGEEQVEADLFLDEIEVTLKAAGEGE